MSQNIGNGMPAQARGTSTIMAAQIACLEQCRNEGPHPATTPWHERVYEHVGLEQRSKEKAAGAWWRDCQLGEQLVGSGHKR